MLSLVFLRPVTHQVNTDSYEKIFGNVYITSMSTIGGAVREENPHNLDVLLHIWVLLQLVLAGLKFRISSERKYRALTRSPASFFMVSIGVSAVLVDSQCLPLYYFKKFYSKRVFDVHFSVLQTR